MGAASPAVHSAVASAVADVNSSHTPKETKPKSYFRNAARGIGEALMRYPGVGLVAGMMMKMPGLRSAASTVFGSEVVARARSKAVVVLGGGGLNLMDRIFGYQKASAETASLEGADHQKSEAAKDSNVFSKLKKMYASVRDRGTHNAALGAVGAALAAISLASLVINPAVWVHAALFAGIAIYGKQIINLCTSLKNFRLERKERLNKEASPEQQKLLAGGQATQSTEKTAPDTAYSIKPSATATHRPGYVTITS